MARTSTLQHTCPLKCRPRPSPCNPCMLLQLLRATPTGGLLRRLLALHWMLDRPTSWLTDTRDQQQILATEWARIKETKISVRQHQRAKDIAVSISLTLKERISATKPLHNKHLIRIWWATTTSHQWVWYILDRTVYLSVSWTAAETPTLTR